MACAAALGAIETIEDAGPASARPRRIGELMLPAAAGAGRRRTPSIGDVRGRGAMLAVELVRPGDREPDAARRRRVAAACHAEGVVVLTCGTYGNVLRFLPPLVIGEDLLRTGWTCSTRRSPQRWHDRAGGRLRTTGGPARPVAESGRVDRSTGPPRSARSTGRCSAS